MNTNSCSPNNVEYLKFYTSLLFLVFLFLVHQDQLYTLLISNVLTVIWSLTLVKERIEK